MVVREDVQYAFPPAKQGVALGIEPGSCFRGIGAHSLKQQARIAKLATFRAGDWASVSSAWQRILPQYGIFGLMGDLEGDAEWKTCFFTHHWTNIGMYVQRSPRLGTHTLHDYLSPTPLTQILSQVVR
jgi:hypothetical protein